MNRVLDVTVGYLTNRTIDVLEWWYDRDVKSRRSKPMGGKRV